MNCDTFQSVSDFSMIVEIHFENELKGMSLAFRVLFAITSGAEKLQNYEVILDPILKLSNNHQITEIQKVFNKLSSTQVNLKLDITV